MNCCTRNGWPAIVRTSSCSSEHVALSINMVLCAEADIAGFTTIFSQLRIVSCSALSTFAWLTNIVDAISMPKASTSRK